MRTIEQLNTLLEELEKRIRTISTAQKTLNQINEILAYIQSVQDYLQELQTTFDSHVQECDDYSTDISNLQTQIDTINQTINNLSTDNEITNQLKTSLAELQTKVDEFIGNSSTTAEALQNDISTLQTDLGSCQDDITDIESEISAINSSIGEQNTTITNLQTTQTNLQTTQSSQASTINNINSRLTTAENNISTLTNGVDLSEYNNRVRELEYTSAPACSCHHVNIPLNYTLPASTKIAPYMQTLVHKEYGNIFIKGTLTFEKLAQNANMSVYAKITGRSVTTTEIKSAFCNEKHEFEIMIKPPSLFNNIYLEISSNTDLNCKNLELFIFGRDMYFNDYESPLYAYCFNNEIYITKITDTKVKFGKFIMDNLSIDNFPYELPLYNETTKFRTIKFLPKPISYTGETIGEYTSGLVKMGYNHILYFDQIENDDISTITTEQISIMNYKPLNFVPVGFDEFMTESTPNGVFSLMEAYNNTGSQLGNLSQMVDGKWTYYTCMQNNYLTPESSMITSPEATIVARNVDGYIYFLTGYLNPYAVKLTQGLRANAYMQQDGSINVYIYDGFDIYKHTLIQNSNGEYELSESKKKTGYSYVFELYDGKALACINDVWSIVNI